MNRFDDENKIIASFQRVNDKEVMFVVRSEEAEFVYRSIHTKALWKKWVDTSGKSDPPPDYYSPEYNLMMEVMRIDDHAYIDDNGKIQNPTNVGESKLYKELKNSGLLRAFPNAEVIINAKTMLPTEQDHNYLLYKANFERVVSEHIKKVPIYQKNHLGYKIVLFVVDESTAYFQCEGGKPDMNIAQKGKQIRGNPHIFFLDKCFVNVFLNSGIDFLIWYAPYKLLTISKKMFKLPKVVVFDCKVGKFDNLIEYEKDKMCSSEL